MQIDLGRSLKRMVVQRASIALAMSSVAAALVGSALPAQAALVKDPLVGPAANIYCNDLSQAPGSDISKAGPGFVVWGESDKTVRAEVVLKGAQANTNYVVRLIQNNQGGNDCFTVDGTLTTDSKGNAEKTISEAKLAGATAAQVIIDTSNEFQTPTYQAKNTFNY